MEGDPLVHAEGLGAAIPADPGTGNHTYSRLGWRSLQRAISCGRFPPFSLCIRPMRLAVVYVKNRKC